MHSVGGAEGAPCCPCRLAEKQRLADLEREKREEEERVMREEEERVRREAEEKRLAAEAARLAQVLHLGNGV